MERETWANNLDFLLSCVGIAVGLGNIWRFPYLCFKNGGGAFFIPYLLFLVFGAAPVLVLEIGLGQFMRLGGYGAWNICPLFQGIGVATNIVVFLMNIYYIFILAWASYYFVASLSSVLPWSHCSNDWNTDRCAVAFKACLNSTYNESLSVNDTGDLNRTLCGSNETVKYRDPTVEFWERKVLNMSDGIEDIGGIQTNMALCLLFVWVVIYFCVWRGVRWTGKVVYFTAFFPYVVLIVMVIRGLTLKGSLNGIKFLFIPDFTRLGDVQVWIDGGTQILFSLAVALGAMTSLGSYNHFNNIFYRDCFIVMLVNSGTSVFGGMAVFAVLGYMAEELGVEVRDVADSGFGLTFITYPRAVQEMPLPQLWATLFFLMVFIVGLDSQFVAVEVFLTPFVDRFPQYLQRHRNRAIFVAMYCAVSFLIGLVMTTRGGIYLFYLFDYYSASGLVLLWICFWECIAIGWIFGAEKFYDAINFMTGRKISQFWKICWRYITPVLRAGLFLFEQCTHKVKSLGQYQYPLWGQILGLCLALVSMLCIPVIMMTNVWQDSSKGFFKKLKNQMSPRITSTQQCPTWLNNKQ